MTTIPRPEHPRPYFQRDAWHNLNGPWRFAFDPQAIGEQMRWQHKAQWGDLEITVPFPWESKLSGVAAPTYKGAGWYQREFTVPAEWQGLRPFLNFEAVDWSARVWINGQFAGEHENGYLPFSIDLSPYAQPGETATITVRAYDIADATTLVGKQVPRWYTHSSGIWQTVWLEGRAASHITSVRIAPDAANKIAEVYADVQADKAGSYTLRVTSQDDAFPPVESIHDLQAGPQEISLRLHIAEPRLWSPETPYLYDVNVTLEAAAGGIPDRVATYFGMRTVSRGGSPSRQSGAGNEYEYILLNGQPVYLRGALDQAFHPDGVHSYPSDEVVRGDIQLAKDLGLNMLRCHIKINDPRYYYWADKLGLLIMYDFPSPDLDTPTMRQIFEATLPRVLARDFNSPSIFAWVLFNETWGLSEHHTEDGRRWLVEMVDRARTLDPTRLIEDNSPCKYDHVETDINSWHFYINDYHRVRQHVQRVVDETYPGSDFNYVGDGYTQKIAPLMNSEYGGIAARMGDQDIAWCFKYQTTELRRHNKICGYVYTELDDIEWEHNGFVNYDRSRKEFGYDFFVDGMTVADLNAADFVGLDAPPCQTLAPGSEFSAPIFVSHWGAALKIGRVRWQLDFTDRFGGERTEDEGIIEKSFARFAVTEVDNLQITLPNEEGLATVAVLFQDAHGNTLCRNYVNIEVRGNNAGTPTAEQRPTGWALRFAPGAYTRTSWQWPPPFSAPSGAKFSATGPGWVEYQVVLPAELDAQSVRRLRLIFEAGARGGNAKVDWKEQINGLNYPQTEVDKKFPTDLAVLVNDVQVGTVQLPDDPADARGVLSHHQQVDPGSYGYLTELMLDGPDLAQALVGQSTLTVRFAVAEDAQHPGGLALYGETLGCYPVGPTILLETS